MIKQITETDLLLFYYQEADEVTTSIIKEHLSNNLDWQFFLNELDSFSNESKSIHFSPSNTTLSIILEESRSQLEHSH
ncbi:MAG: hypothetical protein ACOVP9_05795 [Flavobacterium stagni]|jgi:hypothetical protein